jgi:hypothetical protein
MGNTINSIPPETIAAQTSSNQSFAKGYDGGMALIGALYAGLSDNEEKFMGNFAFNTLPGLEAQQKALQQELEALSSETLPTGSSSENSFVQFFQNIGDGITGGEVNTTAYSQEALVQYQTAITVDDNAASQVGQKINTDIELNVTIPGQMMQSFGKSGTSAMNFFRHFAVAR